MPVMGCDHGQAPETCSFCATDRALEKLCAHRDHALVVAALTLQRAAPHPFTCWAWLDAGTTGACETCTVHHELFNLLAVLPAKGRKGK